MLRLNSPLITKKEKKYVNKVLKSGWISVDGDYNKSFEKKFGKIIKKKYNLLVQSGTASLHLALKSIKIKKNHKILIPNFTCSANINSVLQCNATPVPIEVENETLGMDFQLVKKAINKYKPKAIQIVHVYGFPAKIF